MSPALLPIVNEPAGSGTITGQAAQSLFSPTAELLAAELTGALGAAATGVGGVAGAGAGAGAGAALLATTA